MDCNKTNNNRDKAVESMNNGVGKLNAIIKKFKTDLKSSDTSNKKVALENDVIKNIIELVIGEKDSPKKINLNTFYAAIEALSDFKTNDNAAEAISGLFNELEQQVSGMSEQEQSQAEKEIFQSDKMTAIRFEAYVHQGELDEATKLLPKLQDVNKSHGIVLFSEYFNDSIKSLLTDKLMTEEQVDQTKQTLAVKLNETLEFLDKKFEKTYDFQTGVELLKVKLATGSNMSELKELANNVYLSSKKFNISEFADEKFEDYSLVAQLSGNQEALDSLQRITRNEKLTESNQIINNQVLNNTIKKSQAFKTLSQQEQDKFQANVKDVNDKASQKIEKTDEQKKTDAIIAGSYSYAGTLGNIEEATYVGGNFRFSGQVPDHCITRNDVLVFDTLLKTDIYKLFPLKDVNGSKDDPNNRRIPEGLESVATTQLAQLDFKNDMTTFMKVTDGMIRSRFTTTDFAGKNLNMEEQALLKESVYNDAFKSIMAESGAFGLNVDGNSLTNIATLFAEGLGDCRHHAQIKQIMFDRWKDEKMNQAISSLSEDSANKDQILSDIDDMSRTELRTFDVVISTNLKMDELVGFSSWTDDKGEKVGTVWSGDSMYRPQRNNDGKLSVRTDGGTSPLEEHTMCMLVKRDKTGGLEELKFADAFYQEPEKGGDYDLSYAGNADKNLSSIVDYDSDGKFSFKPGKIFNKSNVAGEESVVVSFSPTAYAGKRDYGLYGKFEHSQICGVEYEKEVTSEQLLNDIAQTEVNHAERIKRAEEYSFMRKCIVRNLVAQNLREEKTLDISPEIREKLEFDCKTQKVSEMTGESEKRLNAICNDLAEMKSPKFSDIYYRTIRSLKEEQEKNPNAELSQEKIEQICDEVSMAYFNEKGYANPKQNREKEITKKAKDVKLYLKSTKDDKKEAYEKAIKYLSLSFPKYVIQKFKKNVEMGDEINLENFIANIETMEAGKQEDLAEESKPKSEENENEVITPDMLRTDPLKITEVSTEQFAENPVEFISALREGVTTLENNNGQNIDSNFFAVVNDNLDKKMVEIQKEIMRNQQENQRQQTNELQQEQENQQQLVNALGRSE